MIRKITLYTFLLLSVATFAQPGAIGHLTIFSEDGDKFTLILNGEIINDTPQTNLRVEDLNQPYYNAKIRFADQSLTEISKNNLTIADADGNFTDVTYKIKRDKNNRTKMNYFSAIPVQPNFVPAPNVHVIHYGQPSGAVVQTTTTTTQNGGANMGVGVNVNGVNMGITINDSMGAHSTTTTTTTTSHSSAPQSPPGRGCGGHSCMSPRDFNAAVSTIKAQSFEETKLKTAKQVISANCLNVDQVMQIANTFNFEDNKLEFVKYAYDYCIEPRNYFKLNGIFSFSSNAEELSDYVQSKQ